MTAKELAKALERVGATWRQGGRGSHRIYSVGTCRTTVSMHRGDIPKGTLRAIERDMEPCLGKGWLTK